MKGLGIYFSEEPLLTSAVILSTADKSFLQLGGKVIRDDVTWWLEVWVLEPGCRFPSQPYGCLCGLGQVFNLVIPKFPLCKMKIRKLLRGLNVIMYIKHLEQGLEKSKHPISIAIIMINSSSNS